MIYQNFFIKAPIAMLDVPLPLSMFVNEDGTHKNIKEYLESRNETIERYSSDGFFLKGFGFNYDGLKELEDNLKTYGLELGVSIFILSPVEVLEELNKDIWNTLEEVPIIVEPKEVINLTEAVELPIPEQVVMEPIVENIVIEEPVTVTEEVDE